MNSKKTNDGDDWDNQDWERFSELPEEGDDKDLYWLRKDLGLTTKE